MPFEAVTDEAGAREGVSSSRKPAPAKEPSYGVEVQLRSSLIPQVAEILPGMRRPAPDTLSFAADSMPQAYALIRFVYRYINPD